MRTRVIFIALLFFHLTVVAQDEAYKGPAKVDVKSFWRQADMFKNGKGSDATLGNMQKALANTKEKDPAYNTAAMEEEIKKWKVGIDKEMEASKSPEQKATEKKLAELSYKGPAKNNVESFWANGTKPYETMGIVELNVAIENMHNSLERTKEKDPAFDAKEMEAALAKFENKRKQLKTEQANEYTGDKVRDAEKIKAKEDKKIMGDPGKLFEDMFENESLQTGAGSVTAEKLKTKIANYKEKSESLFAMDYTDAKIKHTRMSKGVINGMKASTNKKVEEVDVMLGKYRSNEAMEIGYYTMQLHMLYWNTVQKVFNEEPSFKEMYDKVKATADKMGSLESMLAKADANNTQYINDTKLPNALVKDAAMEKLLTDGFNKNFSSQGASALKAVLTQEGWTTLRNSITSVITGRERSAKVAYKGADGKCYVLTDYVFIHEEYIGGSFTNRKAVFNGLFGSEMLCENVK